MNWDWLNCHAVTPGGVKGLELCADDMHHLAADPEGFFRRVCETVHAAADCPARRIEAREDLMEAFDSWPQRIVSKAATAFEKGTPAFLRLNEILAALPRDTSGSVRQIESYLRGVLAALRSSECTASLQAFASLRAAGDAFVKLVSGVLTRAEEVLLAGENTARLQNIEGIECGDYHEFGSPVANAMAREALLRRDGFEVCFPVVIVRENEANEGDVLDVKVQTFASELLRGVAAHPLESGAHRKDFCAAVQNAWKSAENLSRGHFALWRTSTRATPLALKGGSAGGAFALAFRRALQCREYPRRVVVLASIETDGRLGPFAPRLGSDLMNSLKQKVAAIRASNRFDTILTAPEHLETIERLLAGQDRIRTQAVSDGGISAVPKEA